MKNKTKKSAPKVTLDELFECLCFYSEKENFYINDGGLSKIICDNGSKARKILKKLIKETLDKEGIENKI